MREELQPVLKAIEDRQLPTEAGLLFNGLLDTKGLGFAIQETFVLDFKETRPVKFSDDYGASIVRLAMAFHNTYGGLIVFGVRDRDFQVVGTDAPFDVEAFNAVLTARTGQRIECLTRAYDFDGKHLEVLLVPRRAATPPVRLTQDLGKYKKGRLGARPARSAGGALGTPAAALLEPPRAHERARRRGPPAGSPVAAALPSHYKILPRTLQPGGPVRAWVLFSDQPRFYLHGPGGSGKARSRSSSLRAS